jgi:hypothetical protein
MVQIEYLKVLHKYLEQRRVDLKKHAAAEKRGARQAAREAAQESSEEEDDDDDEKEAVEPAEDSNDDGPSASSDSDSSESEEEPPAAPPLAAPAIAPVAIAPAAAPDPAPVPEPAAKRPRVDAAPIRVKIEQVSEPMAPVVAAKAAPAPPVPIAVKAEPAEDLPLGDMLGNLTPAKVSELVQRLVPVEKVKDADSAIHLLNTLLGTNYAWFRTVPVTVRERFYEQMVAQGLVHQKTGTRGGHYKLGGDAMRLRR